MSKIIPQKEAPKNVFKLNLMMRGPDTRDTKMTPPSMAHLFKRAFKKKIDQEIENYFKRLLNEAKENYEANNANGEYVEKTNLREYVKLKVGLDFVK